MKQRKDLPKDRISFKNKIFLNGEEVGKIKKINNERYAYLKYNYGFTFEDFKKILDLMEK